MPATAHGLQGRFNARTVTKRKYPGSAPVPVEPALPHLWHEPVRSLSFTKTVFSEIRGHGGSVTQRVPLRIRVFKGFVEQLARDKGREKDMTLYNNIEKIAPKLIAKQRQIFKGVSPNIDFYSGFVYDMLNIPRELYTPLFAIARIAGWSAHRLEELITTDKIIRPAYKSLVSKKEYIEREER